MKTNSYNLYTCDHIRQLEAAAYKIDSSSSHQLMERAGRAVFDAITQKWPDTRSLMVFCGGGNNGGDGYVVARLAHQAGVKVEVFSLSDPKKLKDAALAAYQAAELAGVSIHAVHSNKKIDFLKTDLIVDALLGTGLKETLRDDYMSVIEQMNESNKPIVAIDVPSGLNTDSGYIHGAAVHAAMTVTFIGLKLGLFTGSGSACCGEVICDDLQISEAVFDKIESNIALIDFDGLRKRTLKPRIKDAHKGAFGHVLAVGGDYGMAGAVRMAGEAALRVGAGLTTVATHFEHALAITANRPELMVHGVEERDELASLLGKATVVAIGPGLGQSSWSRDLFDFVLSTTTLPLIMDADALNLLATREHKKRCRANWILTPHPGEAARLLQVTPEEIARDRVSAAREIGKRYGGICVLKGAGTLICDRKGSIEICAAGNPGMATGGMGDVLTGIIAGLVAQGIELKYAATLGVALHAHAADRAVTRSGERGLLATDLFIPLQELVNL